MEWKDATHVPEKRFLKGLNNFTALTKTVDGGYIGIGSPFPREKDRDSPYYFYVHDNSSDYPQDPIAFLTVWQKGYLFFKEYIII